MNESQPGALPENMTVIEIAEFGGPEGLVAAQRPVELPGAGEVLIEVAAAGVNRPDVLQRLGNYPPPPGASDIPGLEVAGRIAAIGDGVTGFQPGDRICALVAGGGYASHCVAPAPQCLPVPDGLDFVAAAAIPESFFTVWTNVFERGGLAAGESLLVHGGTSGIGTTAIQLGRAFGARVFATAGSDEKCQACRDLGAEYAINYRNEDFVEIVKEKTGGVGVNLVADIVGGDYFPRNIRALATNGRLVQIGVLGGSRAEINLGPFMVKRLTLTGSTLRPRTVAEKAAIADALKENVWPRIAAGEIGPVVHTTFPLDQAADAHRMMEASSHIGKIVLTVPGATN